MTKQRAIWAKCLECGGSAKEVTLCHLFDCPLWPYRCGCHVKSKAYKLRMERAQKRYARDFEEMVRAGIDTSLF